MTESVQDSNLVKWKTMNGQYSQKHAKVCKNQLVSHCSGGMLSRGSNGYCSWVRKICFHSFYCCCVWGNSCRQCTCSQETTALAKILKNPKYAPEQHQKINFHWKCSCALSFNCFQKATFHIWHFFNFSLEETGKAICSNCNKRLWILTNLDPILAHLYLVSICKFCSQCILLVAAKIK